LASGGEATPGGGDGVVAMREADGRKPGGEVVSLFVWAAPVDRITPAVGASAVVRDIDPPSGTALFA
jgi:hypothetical protein